jgi:hypothetical protein
MPQLSLFPDQNDHPDGYKTEKFEAVPLPEEIRAIYARAKFHVAHVRNVWRITAPAGFLVSVIPLADNADPAAALEIAAAAVWGGTAYVAQKPFGLTWTEFYRTIEIRPKNEEELQRHRAALESQEAPPTNTESAPCDTVAPETPQAANDHFTTETMPMQPTITFGPEARRLAQDLRALADIIQEPHLYAHDAPYRVWIVETISFLAALASTALDKELQEDAEILLNLTTTDFIKVLDRPNPISAHAEALIGNIKRAQNTPDSTEDHP